MTSSLLLLQVPSAQVFGSESLAVLPLILALVFGVYFAHRRDSLDQARRAARPAFAGLLLGVNLIG